MGNQDLRKVKFLKGAKRVSAKGYFHQWGIGIVKCGKETFSFTIAIIESIDGGTYSVSAGDFMFNDWKDEHFTE